LGKPSITFRVRCSRILLDSLSWLRPKSAVTFFLVRSKL
jgi:hypothetical protein